jgi:hypothetical protein
MAKSLQKLRVSENKRYLVHEDGTPFFWLGDTAWELFHKLNREEAVMYVKNRAERKFSVVQAVALAEFEGVTTDNAYGRRPFKTNTLGDVDPTLPDTDGEYDYWRHVDFIVLAAAELGIYIALLPTWGDKFHKGRGKGPEIFNEGNAKAYGRWLGNRYKNHVNIIWVLGGDRSLVKKTHFDIVNAMATGIKEGDEGRHLMTFHPLGSYSSSYHLHEEAWLDFNMIQSGHGSGQIENYRKVNEDYEKYPVKPTIDAEPCYEDHPRGFKSENGFFDEADVRIAAYYALFSGAFGHTYGHHSVWSMTTDPKDYFIMNWKDAILRPGASQMQHARALIESKSFFDRVPDQSLIADNYKGSNYMVAARNDRCAMIYSPNGLKFKLVMGKFKRVQVESSWFDPRTGKMISIGELDNNEERSFIPPSSGRGNDWILVLDGND